LGDGVRLEILNPSSPQPPIPSPQHDNDLSVAIRLVYGEFSLLLTGDAGQAAEREMLAPAAYYRPWFTRPGTTGLGRLAARHFWVPSNRST
jgi:competence protein ComEC